MINYEFNSMTKDRFFVPLCEANSSLGLIQSVAKHSRFIGFNLWKVLHSKRLKEIRAVGLHNAFEIPKSTEIWLTSTAPDEWLKKYYSNGINQFKEDVLSFAPDKVQGPDLWMYREDGFDKNTKDWQRAMEYQKSLH